MDAKALIEDVVFASRDRNRSSPPSVRFEDANARADLPVRVPQDLLSRRQLINE
jgi:hypothetical protein